MTVTLAGDPIEIESPIERVWEILTDLVKYPEWNPLNHLAGCSFRLLCYCIVAIY